VDTLTQRLPASGLDRGQAVAQNGGEDVDELAVTRVMNIFGIAPLIAAMRA
jgi:hypothetical protein